VLLAVWHLCELLESCYFIYFTCLNDCACFSHDLFKALCVCCLQIYEGKSNASGGHVLHVTGADTRPFFVSSGNDVTVEFRTGTNIYERYLGFRASYYFVSSMLYAPYGCNALIFIL